MGMFCKNIKNHKKKDYWNIVLECTGVYFMFFIEFQSYNFKMSCLIQCYFPFFNY